MVLFFFSLRVIFILFVLKIVVQNRKSCFSIFVCKANIRNFFKPKMPKMPKIIAIETNLILSRYILCTKQIKYDCIVPVAVTYKLSHVS